VVDIGFKYEWSEPVNSGGAEEAMEASASLLVSPVPSAFLELAAQAFSAAR
jgi:hypothetical protein